jgi:hypothetical protein
MCYLLSLVSYISIGLRTGCDGFAQNILSVPENGVSSRIFGPKEEKVMAKEKSAWSISREF